MAKHMVRLRTSIKMDPEDLPLNEDEDPQAILGPEF